MARRRRRLEFALALIANNRQARKRALHLVRRELSRDMIAQVAAGAWRTTPHEARVWHYQRLDGAILVLDDSSSST